jgi:hypothetical protein
MIAATNWPEAVSVIISGIAGVFLLCVAITGDWPWKGSGK